MSRRPSRSIWKNADDDDDHDDDDGGLFRLYRVLNVAFAARLFHSCNGNFLINIGPRADGTIDAVFEERLLQLGDWLKTNGAAVYGTKPWTTQNDTLNSDVW